MAFFNDVTTTSSSRTAVQVLMGNFINFSVTRIIIIIIIIIFYLKPLVVKIPGVKKNIIIIIIIKNECHSNIIVDRLQGSGLSGSW